MKRFFRSARSLGAAALAAALASGCILVSHGPTEGDIALLWGFEGGYSCGEAGITHVYISIRGQDTSDADEWVMDCREGGATFKDFDEGHYTVHLEGLDANDTVWYAVTRNVFVDAGKTTDLGRVILYSVSGPVVTTGSLQVDWSFFYPAQDATPDCAYAGVDYVRVVVTDAWGVRVFDQSVPCVNGPAVIDYFDPGTYYLDLDGLGSYHGRSVVLYQAPTLEVSIDEGLLTDVGMVALDRREQQFGDFRIEWSFGGNNSCAGVGVSQVTVSIVRLQADVLDYQETIPCIGEPLELATFVPGDYDVVVEADDDLGGYWSGYVTADLGPSTLADVMVRTELTP